MRRLAILVAVLILSPIGAAAAGLPPQRAAYAADQTLSLNGVELTTAVNHLRGMERRRATADGLFSIVLIRPDKGKAWQIQPDMGLALELPIAAPEFGPDLSALHTLDAEPLGRETVAGLPVTKYRVQGAFAEGGGFDGQVWSTDDGIYVRVEGTATDGGEPQAVRLTLGNVRIGPQELAFFELPQGLKVMSLDVIEGRMPPAFQQPDLPPGRPAARQP